MREVLRKLICKIRGHQNAQVVEFYDSVHVHTMLKCLRCSLVASSWTYTIGSSGYERFTEMRRSFFADAPAPVRRKKGRKVCR